MCHMQLIINTLNQFVSYGLIQAFSCDEEISKAQTLETIIGIWWVSYKVLYVFRRSQKNGTNVEEKSNVERRRGTGKTRFLHSAAADIDPFRLSLHRSKSDIIKIFWNLLFVDFRKRPVETRSSKAVHFKLCFYAEVFRRVFSDRARWHTQERAKRSLYENLILRIHYLGLWTPIFWLTKKTIHAHFGQLFLLWERWFQTAKSKFYDDVESWTGTRS